MSTHITRIIYENGPFLRERMKRNFNNGITEISYEEACCLFNNVHLEIAPISKAIATSIAESYPITECVKDLLRCSRIKMNDYTIK